MAGASACDAEEELGTAVTASQRSTGWWDKETFPPVGQQGCLSSLGGVRGAPRIAQDEKSD